MDLRTVIPGLPALRCIDTDGSGVWVAGFQDLTTRRSTDNGVTWTLLPDFPTMTSVGTDRNGTWLAADEFTGKRSTDNGATWTTILSGEETLYFLAGWTTDRAGVWMCIEAWAGHTLRSTDNGLTWSEVEDFPSCDALATDRAGIWFVGFEDEDTLFSTDNGETWAPVPDLLYAGQIVTDTHGVWVIGRYSDNTTLRSTDNGATFAPVDGLIGMNVAATDTRGTWLAYFNDGVCRISTDDAFSWTPQLDVQAVGNIACDEQLIDSPTWLLGNTNYDTGVDTVRRTPVVGPFLFWTDLQKTREIP